MDTSDLVLLTAPQLSREAFGEMLRDYSRAGTPFLGMYDQSDYDDFCAMCVMHSQGKRLPRGNTPYTRYFLCDRAGNICAQGDVRHAPTPELTDFSGYLGYGVPPSMRRRGYGTVMCARLLETAWQYYDSVIITCRFDNEASRRVIETNGGRLLDVRWWKKNACFMRRYAVDRR